MIHHDASNMSVFIMQRGSHHPRKDDTSCVNFAAASTFEMCAASMISNLAFGIFDFNNSAAGMGVDLSCSPAIINVWHAICGSNSR